MPRKTNADPAAPRGRGARPRADKPAVVIRRQFSPCPDAMLRAAAALLDAEPNAAPEDGATIVDCAATGNAERGTAR